MIVLIEHIAKDKKLNIYKICGKLEKNKSNPTIIKRLYNYDMNSNNVVFHENIDKYILLKI